MRKSAQLRHQVVVERFTSTHDGTGGSTKSWETFATVRAFILPYRGREAVESMKDTGKISHKIIIRYLSGLTTADRIKFGTRIFDIESVINVEERCREQHIMATEIVT